MHPVRRSAALTLLLLLTVTFGPLLCRIGGDQAWLAGRAATAAADWRAGDVTPAATPDTTAPDTTAPDTTAPDTTGPADGIAAARPAAAHHGPLLDPDAPLLDPDAPLAVAHAPKRCSDRHAPGPDEGAPLPAPHRGEPLAPAAIGPGPLALDLPVQCALARPPTDSASVIDHTALLPVLRI
ncbi:hypothetical protein [Streptomyces platensis]|uniref:hypothetical protein n=1 Tax=Streptomyces platensis TaxID=58346 RepID=UPI003864E784|nr:hypothetical protein OG962_26150 [Streptomyces platensis]